MVNCYQFETLPSHEALKHTLSSSALGRELLSIFALKNLTTVFQPIVDIRKRSVLGFEALTRGPDNSPLYRPLHLFHVASEQGCLFEMDLLARQTAIERYHEFGNREPLFLNVTVNALMENSFKSHKTLECLETFGLSASQVVIEITELQPVEDFDMFIKSINHYREMGFKVAIDDLGGGYNGLRIWSEVKPDYVKIDKHFISGLAHDKDKQRFIETICALAKGLGTQIIAEGVEDEATLKSLEGFGVEYVQGYLFKRPNPVPALELDYQWSEPDAPKLSKKEETVACVVKETECVLPDAPVSEVTEFLLNHTEIDYLPVVEQGRVLGIIWRKQLMDLLAHRYGRDLHQRKPVCKVMDTDPIVVDSGMPLVELSRIVTDHGDHRKDGVFIVTEGNTYLGCGSFIDLLRVITDLKVKSAQYANPLSGLPGNVPIHNIIQGYLEQQDEFAVIYIDMDHFKAYNDFYSFEQGDDIIRNMSAILGRHTKENKDFVGHIGGDDFIIVTPRVKRHESICKKVIEDFNDVASGYYSEEDRARGGILAKDREGQERLFPLMSLSLGVLLVYPGVFSHQQMVTSYATKAKKQAKAQGGNSYAVIDSSTLKDKP